MCIRDSVYPAEVERVIALLPEVDEVVVVGAPHEKWGETVTAVISLRPPDGAGTPGAAQAWLGHAPGTIRTCDLCLRRAALYPLSYGRVPGSLPTPANRSAVLDM